MSRSGSPPLTCTSNWRQSFHLLRNGQLLIALYFSSHIGKSLLFLVISSLSCIMNWLSHFLSTLFKMYPDTPSGPIAFLSSNTFIISSFSSLFIMISHFSYFLLSLFLANYYIFLSFSKLVFFLFSSMLDPLSSLLLYTPLNHTFFYPFFFYCIKLNVFLGQDNLDGLW